MGLCRLKHHNVQPSTLMRSLTLTTDLTFEVGNNFWFAKFEEKSSDILWRWVYLILQKQVDVENHFTAFTRKVTKCVICSCCASLSHIIDKDSKVRFYKGTGFSQRRKVNEKLQSLSTDLF